MQEAGSELAEAAWELGGTAAAFDGEGILALGEPETHLAIVVEVADEVGAGGFAFDETDLGHFARNGEVVVIGAKDAGADGIDNANRLETHLGGDAAVAHAIKPAAGFFFQRFVQFGFAGHGSPLPIAGHGRKKPNQLQTQA
jgi:hypothetical protein